MIPIRICVSVAIVISQHHWVSDDGIRNIEDATVPFRISRCTCLGATRGYYGFPKMRWKFDHDVYRIQSAKRIIKLRHIDRPICNDIEAASLGNFERICDDQAIRPRDEWTERGEQQGRRPDRRQGRRRPERRHRLPRGRRQREVAASGRRVVTARRGGTLTGRTSRPER